MKNLLKEFREFASRGNVLDLAVGVVIGTAFGGIVTSFVNDMLMPPLSLLSGSVNFADRFISLGGDYETLAQAKAAGAATINYGLFFNAILNFVIVAFAVFLMVKQINRLKTFGLVAQKTTRACPYCTMEIANTATRCPHCTSTLDNASA